MEHGIDDRLRTRLTALRPHPVGSPSGPATAAAAQPAQPELTDAAVRGATGRGWDDWCRLIGDWDGHERGHTAVAAWLQEAHDLDGWWAQGITVGWERLTGRRLPHQQPDGTFTAGRSATIRTDAVELARVLRDPDALEVLFRGLEPRLRSRPTSKAVRVGLTHGIVELSIVPRADGRTTVTVAHTKLSSLDDVAAWKRYWGAWLAAIDGDDG